MRVSHHHMTRLRGWLSLVLLNKIWFLILIRYLNFLLRLPSTFKAVIQAKENEKRERSKFERSTATCRSPPVFRQIE